MKRILIPTQSANDWQRLLAKPDLHRKAGASAMAAASSWESANGFPREIAAALESGPEELCGLELLFAVSGLEAEPRRGYPAAYGACVAMAYRRERSETYITPWLIVGVL